MELAFVDGIQNCLLKGKKNTIENYEPSTNHQAANMRRKKNCLDRPLGLLGGILLFDAEKKHVSYFLDIASCFRAAALRHCVKIAYAYHHSLER